MGTLPFTASFDVLAFIVKEIRQAHAHPETAELVPTLSFCLNSCAWEGRWEDGTERIIEYIPYEHFLLGWNQPEDTHDAVEVDVLGTKLFVYPETLARLAGKRLVLKAETQRRILVARA